MAFVQSGEQAISRLQHRPYDVIVTGLRMSGIDGVPLLEIAARRWPETIRVAFSGCSRAEEAARMLGLAH